MGFAFAYLLLSSIFFVLVGYCIYVIACINRLLSFQLSLLSTVSLCGGTLLCNLVVKPHFVYYLIPY